MTHRLVQASRAATVLRPGPRAFIMEVSSSSEGRYRLRRGGWTVIIRHRTRDVEILNEIFSHHAYAPPEEIAARLSSRPLRVLDIGGNIGLFGLYVAETWRIQSIVSYEPDPVNARLLSTVVAANTIEWRVHPEAVSNSAGTLRFLAGAFSESRIADPGDRETIEVPVVDLFGMDLDVDLMKIDIEGAEWPILTDARMAGVTVPMLVMEWHRRGCPESDPRACAERALQAAGYDIMQSKGRKSSGTIWASR